VQRLGKNINGYFGDTIDIAVVLGDCIQAARSHGWQIEDLTASPKPNLLAFTRRVPTEPGKPERNIYISTGIHGDEPAGPLAVRNLLQQNQWPAGISLFVLPCLNPTGFVLNQRENDEGTDLNRQYLHPKAEETLAHIAWLNRQPKFQMCLCLHEDWESNGFYVYELNPDQRPSLAPAMLDKVSQVCPIDLSEIIEGRPAQQGIIRPALDPRTRELWPESFYLLTQKTRLSYTLEAASDFPITTRVAALEAAVQAALAH
jgi:protein MpaA